MRTIPQSLGPLYAPRPLEAAALAAFADDRSLILRVLNSGLGPDELFDELIYRELGRSLFLQLAAPTPEAIAALSPCAVDAIDDLQRFRESEPVRQCAAIDALIALRAEQALAHTVRWSADYIEARGLSSCVVFALREAIDRLVPKEAR